MGCADAYVVNVSSVPLPLTEPAELVAVARKWYLVAGFRPVRSTATGRSVVPEPMSTGLAGVVAALAYPVALKAASVTYSNW